MTTLLCLLAPLSVPFRASASDEPVMFVHPSGVSAPSPAIISPLHPTGPEAVLCGDLNYDGVNGLAAQRWDSIGLESWVLAYCDIEGEVQIQGFNWVAVEWKGWNWFGLADFAIWDAGTVENGCADDSNTIASGRDLLSSRNLAECGFQFCFWRDHVSLPDPPVLAPGQYYFAVRNVTEGHQSYIATAPCNGRKPIYFHSDFFDFPCAVPSMEVFGVDYCVAIEVLGAPPFPCENDGCGTLKKLACRGSPTFNVVARGSGTPGGEITVNLDGEDACATVNSRGKWKLAALNAPGTHTARACGSSKTCTH